MCSLIFRETIENFDSHIYIDFRCVVRRIIKNVCKSKLNYTVNYRVRLEQPAITCGYRNVRMAVKAVGDSIKYGACLSSLLRLSSYEEESEMLKKRIVPMARTHALAGGQLASSATFAHNLTAYERRTQLGIGLKFHSIHRDMPFKMTTSRRPDQIRSDAPVSRTGITLLWVAVFEFFNLHSMYYIIYLIIQSFV